MGVLPDYQRSGIGEWLIQTSIEDAFSKGIERIGLEVFSTNEGAIRLYKKVGFQPEGIKKDERRIDGREHNFRLMALFSEPNSTR